LVIPTFNDEYTIVEQVKTCEKILKRYCNDYEIIIADDFSKDRTRELLKTNFLQMKNYKIIFNKRNLGITQNVRQLYFLGKKDFILFYSADGDWNPNDLSHLIQTQIKYNADIVIGKRDKKIGYTPYRRLISYFHKLLPLLLFGVDTIDPGGIKLVKRNLAQIKLISSSQFFEAEIIIKAKKGGYIISWCPVIYKKTFYGSGYGGAFFSAFWSIIDVFKLKFLTFLG